MDQNIELNSNDFTKDQQKNFINNQNVLNTLDEPKRVSLKRDLNDILAKTKVALFPMVKKNSKLLQEWDFWGPLIFSLLLGLILSFQRNDENSGLVFILIFVIVWIGGLIVSLNSQFLGVNLSIFQCICVLGYCMFSIVLAALLNLIFSFLPLIIHIIFSLVGCLYAIYSKKIFLYYIFFYRCFYFCWTLC